MIYSFSQLASVSAVLGGFAFVFLGALISGDAPSRPKLWTAALVSPAAACFILCALGWSLVSAGLAGATTDGAAILPNSIRAVHATLSPVFLMGVMFFSLQSGRAAGCTRSH